MSIGHDDLAEHLLPELRAPGLGPGEEELLIVGEARFLDL
jgi:hypothetical protein